MDSLMALQLVRTLRCGLHMPDLGLSTIYSNPTVDQLSTSVLGQGDKAKKSDALLMEPMLHAHRALIEQIPKPADLGTTGMSNPLTVVLTGSTGTIGTFLYSIDQASVAFFAWIALKPVGKISRSCGWPRGD